MSDEAKRSEDADTLGGEYTYEVRAAMRLIQRAVKHHWDIPPEWLEKFPKVAAQIAANPERSARDRMRAIELLAALRRQDIDVAQIADKLERLEEGSATERSETHYKIIAGIDESKV